MSAIPLFDYTRTEDEALAKPGRFVPVYPDVVVDDGQMGGDYQDGEGWGRRFVRFLPELNRWEVVTDYFYVCSLEDDETGAVRRWVENQTERILCTDFRDPGSTEELSDTRHVVHSEATDTESARVMAGQVTPDSYWALPTPVWLVEAHRSGRAYPHRRSPK
jgi:hypothetical protein